MKMLLISNKTINKN